MTGLSSFFECSIAWICSAVMLAFARIRPSGSPVIDTNVKNRKLVARSTGTLYRSRRATYAAISSSAQRMRTLVTATAPTSFGANFDQSQVSFVSRRPRNRRRAGSGFGRASDALASPDRDGVAGHCCGFMPRACETRSSYSDKFAACAVVVSAARPNSAGATRESGPPGHTRSLDPRRGFALIGVVWLASWTHRRLLRAESLEAKAFAGWRR